MRICAILALFCGTLSATAQDFSPIEMERAIRAAYEGCLETQRNHPDNVGVTLSTMQSYCRCTAHKVVSRMTRSRVDDFQRNNQFANADMIGMAQQAGQECKRELGF